VSEIGDDAYARRVIDRGRDELDEALAYAHEAARTYLEGIDQRAVRGAAADTAARAYDEPLPQRGAGALETLERLTELSDAAAIASAGPRFFHFVIGGSTPAALAADWLTSALDQNAFAWVSSPLASRLEAVSLAWLRELLELPDSWGGVITTGATTANIVGLAAARHWWGERHGVDVDQEGFAGLPRVPVLSSGYIHASAIKALAALGIGRSSVRTFSADGTGRLDAEALGAALRALDGAPAILIGNAGEVNTGDFDDLEALADLAEEHGAWLHVDGAFGAFARMTPRATGLAAGLERAHSVTADGHKWLNVPYDCGYAFVRDPTAPARTFTLAASYLPPPPGDADPSFGFSSLESSRRARGIATWATLRAYGRDGYRELVERHLDLAQHLAAQVETAVDFELLAPAKLNIVCFRYRPPGVPEHELDELNERLGAALLEDGRVFVGTTRYDGRAAFRPAIVNWRTREEDVDLILAVIRELAA
jgi:glutamate/tyrosine decarboxylase-like PLP-dependent enzyme